MTHRRKVTLAAHVLAPAPKGTWPFSPGTTGRPKPGDPPSAPWDVCRSHNRPAWTTETNKIWPNIMQAIGATPAG